MQEKILDLGWSHPPYSPRNFYVFPLLQNAQNKKKKFPQEDQVKMFAENFLNLKPAKFYSRGIDKLLDKWQEVLENNNE